MIGDGCKGDSEGGCDCDCDSEGDCKCDCDCDCDSEDDCDSEGDCKCDSEVGFEISISEEFLSSFSYNVVDLDSE